MENVLTMSLSGFRPVDIYIDICMLCRERIDDLDGECTQYSTLRIERSALTKSFR